VIDTPCSPRCKHDCTASCMHAMQVLDGRVCWSASDCRKLETSAESCVENNHSSSGPMRSAQVRRVRQRVLRNSHYISMETHYIWSSAIHTAMVCKSFQLGNVGVQIHSAKHTHTPPPNPGASRAGPRQHGRLPVSSTPQSTVATATGKA
jgi:hypothetical protein